MSWCPSTPSLPEKITTLTTASGHQTSLEKRITPASKTLWSRKQIRRSRRAWTVSNLRSPAPMAKPQNSSSSIKAWQEALLRPSTWATIQTTIISRFASCPTTSDPWRLRICPLTSVTTNGAKFKNLARGSIRSRSRSRSNSMKRRRSRCVRCSTSRSRWGQSCASKQRKSEKISTRR